MLHDARKLALGKLQCEVHGAIECPVRAVSYILHEGREADVRCNLHQGPLSRTLLPLA